MVDLNPSPPFIFPTPPSPPPHPQKTNLSMLYYGLAVVGTAAIVLAMYNLIIIKWCTQRQDRSVRGQNRLIEVTAGRSLEHSNTNLLSSFKYRKENHDTGVQDLGSEYECPVCLSVFEDGEEVRQLPRCKHSFHAPCIDMWLCSHSDCPLCRAHVDPPPMFATQLAASTVSNTPENSREGLLDSGLSV